MADKDAYRAARYIQSLGVPNTVGGGSKWNPEARSDNCVWVCVARSINLTVPELSESVHLPVPAAGATLDDIAFFISSVCDRHDIAPQFGRRGRLPLIIGYRTADGRAHCILRCPGKDVCFQHRSDGADLSEQLRRRDTVQLFVWSWKNFQCPRPEDEHLGKYGSLWDPWVPVSKRPPHRTRKPAR